MPLRGLIPKEDKDELNLLLEKAFNAESDHRFLRLHKQKPLEKDWGRIFEYDPAVDKELNINEKKIIAHFGIYPSHMQYGKSVLLHGGIRDVATDPNPMFRGNGYGLRVMEDAKQYMFDHEVDFSLLFSGAGPFYMKGGYQGGVMEQKYLLRKNNLETLLKKQLNLSEFKKEDINIKLIEEKDFPEISELYDNTHTGLYMSMERGLEYWEKHFEVNPQLHWNYLVAKVNSSLISYFKFELENIKKNEIIPVITECRIAQLISAPGSQAINIIIQSFIDFIKEEAIEDDDEIVGLKINLSKNHPLYQHFKYEGFELLDKSHYGRTIMFLITNPYSLFIRLKEEIIDRFSNELLPSGKFYMKFDLSGKFPGGMILDTNTNYSSCKISVVKTDKEFEGLKKGIENGLEFTNITALTLYFAGIEPAEELDEDDAEGEELFKSVGNGLDWLKGLFSGISYDHYNLDHY